MTNPYYNGGAFPATGAPATSASMRAELTLISGGFDKLPTLLSNANKLIVVNPSASGLEATGTIPALAVPDANLVIEDNADSTRKFRFEASGITAGATRVLTVPDANLTLVGTDTVQTLTNKTINLTNNFFTGTLPVANGGTNLTTFPALSLPVANTLNTLSALTATASQSIRVNGGGNAWEAYTPSTGDVVGPASAVSGNIATFNGTTGKLIQDGGKALPTGTIVGTSDTQTLTNKTLTDPAITGTILEDVYTISDGAAFEIDPGNGSVQLITLGANRTPKATNFASGEAITLMVDDGSARTLTWTDATWGGSGVVWFGDGGNAPTLATTGYTTIVLWKVATQVYGARVGGV